MVQVQTANHFKTKLQVHTTQEPKHVLKGLNN